MLVAASIVFSGAAIVTWLADLAAKKAESSSNLAALATCFAQIALGLIIAHFIIKY